MANATRRGNVGTTPFGDYGTKRGAVNTAQTFYANSMIGLNTSGYADKMDDAAGKKFDGVLATVSQEVLSGGSNGDVLLDVVQPRFITLTFGSITVADIDKTVYAVDDQTGTVATTTTYGNVIGRLTAVISSTVGVVECYYGGKAANKLLGSARVLAATGAQSLTKYDLNKTILVPSTGAYALTLPAVADTQAGDMLTIVKTTSNAVAVTLTGNAAETIDGSNTLATIDAQYDTAILVSTGAAWIVVARDIS